MVWSWMIHLKREQKLKLLHELLLKNLSIEIVICSMNGASELMKMEFIIY